MKFRLEFGSNEHLSVPLFQAWLDAHPTIAKQVEVVIYGESADDHADVKAYSIYEVPDYNMVGYMSGPKPGEIITELLWVAEIKIDSDAKKSRNDRHYHNNLAKLRDDYTCPRYVFILDTGKMETVQHRATNKWHKQAIFSKSLIGDLMTKAIVMGKCIPRYLKATRFGDIIWELLQTPIPTIDCGVRYLERKPGSKWEQSLQAFDGVNAANAALIAQRYPSMVELIMDGAFGHHSFDGLWLELDNVWPPTVENEEHKGRVKFIKQIGGMQE